MTIIDKLFAIIFARYRRKLGDAKIESAWYRANNRVVGYLLFPIAAILYFIFAIIYFPVVKGSAFDHRRPLILVGAAIYVISAFALGRGFNVFLKNPPRLNSEETDAESRFVFWFRAICYGLFGVACLIAFALHDAGFPVIH